MCNFYTYITSNIFIAVFFFICRAGENIATFPAFSGLRSPRKSDSYNFSLTLPRGNPRILNIFIIARTMESSSSSNSCGEQDDVLSCEVVCLIYLPLSNTRRSIQSCIRTYQVFL